MEIKTPLDKLLSLTMNQIKLYNIAWECYQRGYYNLKDFNKFLEANKINIF